MMQGGIQPISDIFWQGGEGGLGDFYVVKYSSRSQEHLTAHKPEPHETLKN